MSEDAVGEVGGILPVRPLPCPARYSAAWAVEFAPPATATWSGPQALASSSVAAAGPPGSPVPARPARPANPARPASEPGGR